MQYEIEVAGLKRDLPLCKVNDELYIAAFVIIGDAELTVNCAKSLLEVAPDYDVIVTAEAKGIPLVHEMARQSKIYKYVVARKSPKLYMENVFATEVNSISTEKTQMLYLDQVDADYIKGKRVLIVDDVISTGESLSALKTLVEKAQGNIAGQLTILAEGDAQDRDDIIYLEKLPIFNSDGTIKK